jgi:DNA polymerase III subunit delta'
MNNDLSFDSLVGQEQAKALIGRLFTSGRRAHAYLFRGPDGVGKKRAAVVVAARLNCDKPDERGACGTCRACRKLRSGNHPDFVVVSPDNGTIKIERTRELCRSLSYPPYESANRVILIEDVHAMTPEAANCLLKTLEEPPEGNLLILTAESSRELLPTIVSRCQTIPFYSLPPEACARVIQDQQPDTNSEEAMLLAELAGGSPGAALSLKHKELPALYQRLLDLLEAKPAADGDALTPVLEAAADLAALKEDMALLLGLLRVWVRNQMLADRSGDHIDVLRNRLSALEKAERQLERNCNRALVCEVLLFNLQSPEPAVSS